MEVGVEMKNKKMGQNLVKQLGPPSPNTHTHNTLISLYRAGYTPLSHIIRLQVYTLGKAKLALDYMLASIIKSTVAKSVSNTWDHHHLNGTNILKKKHRTIIKHMVS